jgi:hypothetical protein
MLAAGISAARSASRSVGRHSAAKRILYLVTVAGIAVFLVTIQSQRARLDGVRGTGDVSGIRNIKVGAVVQAKAAALGMIRPLVVLTDLGGCSLGLEDSEIIDVVGLADYAIAHHAGNVQARADYLIQEGLPAYISAGWGPSEYINGIPHLLEHYQQGPEMYELKGLTSDDDPRCPGGKAAIVKMSMASLQEKVEETMATDPVTALALWRCAFAYLSSDRLPPSSWRQQVGMRSESMGDAAVAASDIERAVRYFSLTAVLSGGDAWKRRKAELFRARLFAASK